MQVSNLSKVNHKDYITRKKEPLKGLKRAKKVHHDLGLDSPHALFLSYNIII